jgi:cyanate lyase
MDEHSENTKLLERLVSLTQDQNRLIEQLIDLNEKIIQLLTPPPSDDVASLKVTVDPPEKQ